jgi:DNA-binding LytR/AlgR family response regulator
MEPISVNSPMNEKVELSQSFMNSKWIIIGLIIILFIILIIIFNRKPIISLKSESKKDYIFVRSDRSDVKLFFDKVIALEAMKDYTKIVVKENSYMVHGNISSFIKKFPKDKFVRIHRSTVINVDFITSFEGSTVNLERNHYTIGGKYMSDIKKYLN